MTPRDIDIHALALDKIGRCLGHERARNLVVVVVGARGVERAERSGAVAGAGAISPPHTRAGRL